MVRRALRQAAVAASFCVYVAVPVARPQQAEPGSGAVVVQPGAPGKPSRTLPPDAKAVPPQLSTADVAFMQGMIMHHAQAVEMTAMIPLHTQNKDVRLLGAKISSSQADEMGFMRRWLGARGEPTAMPGTATHGTAEMPDMPGMQMAGQPMMMPGMLSAKQMAALRQARGPEFDRLFLAGMVQHHNGALVMVQELFNTAGAGQDADLFNFATDADNTQRAEIRIMQSMLQKDTSQKR